MWIIILIILFIILLVTIYILEHAPQTMFFNVFTKLVLLIIFAIGVIIVDYSVRSKIELLSRTEDSSRDTKDIIDFVEKQIFLFPLYVYACMFAIVMGYLVLYILTMSIIPKLPYNISQFQNLENGEVNDNTALAANAPAPADNAAVGDGDDDGDAEERSSTHNFSKIIHILTISLFIVIPVHFLCFSTYRLIKEKPTDVEKVKKDFKTFKIITLILIIITMSIIIVSGNSSFIENLQLHPFSLQEGMNGMGHLKTSMIVVVLVFFVAYANNIAGVSN